jgi:peptidylamidoglycolate lyase
VTIIKKAIYLILIITGLLVVCYFFQPIKKGKGLDETNKYQLVKNWPNLPKDFLLGNPTGIDIDTDNNVVVFHRGDRKWPLIGSMSEKPIKNNTILILDSKDGKIIDGWGKNMFIMPHGLTVDAQNNIWITDVGLHQAFKFSHDGKLLLQLGEANVSGNDSGHFNKPTDIAIAKDGSFYVTDGYGNNRVVKFSAKGNIYSNGVKEVINKVSLIYLMPSP